MLSLVAAPYTAKEYVAPAPRRAREPVWVFLTSVAENSGYKALPTRVVPPGAVNKNLPRASMFFKVEAEPEDLLLYNIKRGIQLTMQEIKNCMSSRGIQKPTKGSGKKKGVTKRDLAFVLIKNLFPKADDGSIQAMMAGLMGQTRVESPETLLTLVANLDTQEAEHFGKLKQSAANELERRTEVKVNTERKHAKLPNAEDLLHQRPAAAKDPAAPGPAPGPKGAVASHQKVRAPPEVRNLLPPGITDCYITMRFQKRLCTVEFKSFLHAFQKA